MKKLRRYAFPVLLLLLVMACVKPYEPQVIKESNAFLVVDGIINCAPGGQTSIRLTRTRKLSDTVTSIAERGARITIESESGDAYSLQEAENGLYVSLPLTLNTTNRYRLKISTADGATFESDFVPVTITPPIDSLAWKEADQKVNITLNTHDPQNKTRYYRWEYEETWEYHAAYESFLKLQNGRVAFRDSSELTYACWHSNVSANILQQSTTQLSEDVIRHAPIISFASNSPKLEVRYSIKVKQFALTKEAYEYWEILQRNTQQLGSLFDAQPSQLIGNLHNVAKEDEPVIGYITAATVQEKRIFIRRSEIVDGYRPQTACVPIVIPSDSAAYYLKNPLYALAYYVGSGGGAVAISTNECVDCRLAGGTRSKPPFWP